ncbi:conserved hypothetical protein [Desulfamplus magnetovallimortis]|uniref:Purine nucleoside phosphorylase n=1 Tax=Desulfamplus magnetovallimortis TaxID=1246637 RepID=A0A1W1HCG6_9BACT|nr:peptidoglycan editing factor PgeF [Desulfamplus magnetovallimortis]SLM30126.1 conserved hypothetical protein [Desulfamplus magnetovallimortis]
METGKTEKSALDLEYYTFDNLSRYNGIYQRVFTRRGGVSSHPFNELNVSLSTGDKRENVLKNRELIAASLNVTSHKMIYLNQVHGKDFLVYRKDDKKSSSVDSLSSNIVDADGIVTDVKGIFPVIQVADCQAVILYDPVKNVVANIHSGWRGTVIDIIGNGVDIMTQSFGTKPSDILAGIAPSLGPCCSEFKNYKDEIPENLWKYRIDTDSLETGYNFDFWKISFDQLTEKGVKPENIEISGICTVCNTGEFFSYRGENRTGRFAVVAGIV